MLAERLEVAAVPALRMACCRTQRCCCVPHLAAEGLQTSTGSSCQWSLVLTATSVAAVLMLQYLFREDLQSSERVIVLIVCFIA